MGERVAERNWMENGGRWKGTWSGAPLSATLAATASDNMSIPSSVYDTLSTK